MISKDSAAKLLLTPFALSAERLGFATGFNGDFRDPARHAMPNGALKSFLSQVHWPKNISIAKTLPHPFLDGKNIFGILDYGWSKCPKVTGQEYIILASRGRALHEAAGQVLLFSNLVVDGHGRVLTRISHTSLGRKRRKPREAGDWH